jgi:putative hemolysin
MGIDQSRHPPGRSRPYTGSMAVLRTAPASTGTSGYTLSIAADASDVAAAQRLRHDVFAGELGARLPSAADGRDIDAFDDYSDHLIVRDDLTGAVVGTYRMLDPKAAVRAGRRYGDAEFAPPLLRGYLRLGSWVCGEPAYDGDFDCADFFVPFSMDRMDARYRRHFLGVTR